MDAAIDTMRPIEDIARPYDVVVIGGGQAGLAAGYYLARRGLRFVILEGEARIGDNWRSRWDSLRIFTPARYDGLPGMAFPAPPHAFPTGRQMADYLEAYAATMQLPIQTGVCVERLARAAGGDGYVVTAGGRRFTAAQVVVATGPERTPKIPDFADQLDPAIRQLHSSEYRNPSQLRPGAALVVGAGNSGADIALELARERHVILSGRDLGAVPFRIETWRARVILRLLWFVANHVLTLDTPIGRKMSPYVRSHGGPLVRVKPADLLAAGVERVVARTVGVRDGRPVLADGRVVEIANVIWCTGFRLDFGWIDLPIIGADGWPAQDRGVATAAPGLYFLGLPFQRSFGSMLIGGVGRDAAYIADRVAARARVERRPAGRAAEPAR